MQNKMKTTWLHHSFPDKKFLSFLIKKIWSKNLILVPSECGTNGDKALSSKLFLVQYNKNTLPTKIKHCWMM